MTESSEHEELVEMIKLYALRTHQEINQACIQIDRGDFDYKPSQMIDGYRPDFQYRWNDILIVGEAKTSFDLERKHSLAQYESYLNYCERYDGESYFILSTTWQYQNTAKNLLKE